MPDKTINSTIEILGKNYPVRCLESEFASLQQAAIYLNEQMLAVQESGKAINVERIAIITALNMAHQLLQSYQQKDSFMDKVNRRITDIQDKLEHAMHKARQTELIYTTE